MCRVVDAHLSIRLHLDGNVHEILNHAFSIVFEYIMFPALLELPSHQI